MINFNKNINRILITGGSGFIGGTLIRRLLNNSDINIYNLDKLSYASNLEVINNKFDQKRYKLLKVDLTNKEETKKAIDEVNPDIIFHLAAESHVDRSIKGPRVFIESNIISLTKKNLNDMAKFKFYI